MDMSLKQTYATLTNVRASITTLSTLYFLVELFYLSNSRRRQVSYLLSNLLQMTEIFFCVDLNLNGFYSLVFYHPGSGALESRLCIYLVSIKTTCYYKTLILNHNKEHKINHRNIFRLGRHINGDINSSHDLHIIQVVLTSDEVISFNICATYLNPTNC